MSGQLGRNMYIWKLAPVAAAEGGAEQIAKKAARAKIGGLWVKIVDGRTPYANVTGENLNLFKTLIEKCYEKQIKVWGWHVPHCKTQDAAKAEAETVRELALKLKLDGIISDAESGGSFFQGGRDEAIVYAEAMRATADELEKPFGVSGHDIPQHFTDWAPKFNEIASRADFNFPQVYYGSSTSVESRLSRAERGNAHLSLPFVPVGAGWIGPDGGCRSASACGERARTFIHLVKERGYEGYSFWHWGGAPLPLWEVLNSTAA